MSLLTKTDPELFAPISLEAKRQEEHIELIASENYTYKEVLELQGSILTNKYAEGYPGNRYYGGCEFVDQIEQLAIDRLKALYNVEYANVQPHSGSSANFAVFLSLLKPGDRILGLDLSHGGHLTHGSKVNFSGKLFDSQFYTLDPNTGYIDYDLAKKIAIEVKPKLIICGYSAYPRTIDWQKFREIAGSVGAYLMADIAHISGLVAAGLHQSPVEFVDVITSTTHKTLRGPRSGIIMSNSKFAKKLNSAIFPGAQGGPLMHVIAAKAFAFKKAMEPEFVTYQRQVLRNAKIMAARFMEYGYDLVSGGTDNHLMLIDLTNKGITGLEAEQLLGKANITLNKNSVPFDQNSPKVTSGIRIGTAAITTRGMDEGHCTKIVDLIHSLLSDNSHDHIMDVKHKVVELCREVPLKNFYEMSQLQKS